MIEVWLIRSSGMDRVPARLSGLQRALTHQGETSRRFFLEGSAGAVDPGDHGYAVESLPDPHGGLDLLADAQIFSALDHH